MPPQKHNLLVFRTKERNLNLTFGTAVASFEADMILLFPYSVSGSDVDHQM